MKYYMFSLAALEAEAMWDFAQKNEVNFKFMKQTELKDDSDLIRAALNRRYIYGGYMSEETYLMFILTVPGVLPE